MVGNARKRGVVRRFLTAINVPVAVRNGMRFGSSNRRIEKLL
jgi:hypothetical protein